MTKWLKEQSTAIKQRGNLIVSASAGSGKTTVLVAKIIDMLVDGVQLKRIVVVTFTKLAAAEMKEKLAEKIAERMREEPTLRPLLAKQLEDMPFCNITTIDGYCSTLFKRYFNELNEDSKFDIVESDEGEALFATAVDAVLSARFESGDPLFLELIGCTSNKRRTDGLAKLVAAIYRFWEVQPDRTACVNAARAELKKAPSDRECVRWGLLRIRKRADFLEKAVRNIKARAKTQGTDIWDKVFEAMLDNASRLANVKDLKDLSDQLNHRAPFATMPRTQEAVNDELKPDIYRLRDAIKAMVVELEGIIGDYAKATFRDAAASRFDELLFELTEDVSKEYSRLKRAAGKLDFADLEHFALRILSDATRRKEVQNEIDYVFLDEYQDTNYLQESILDSISSGNNVFMVGDVKQCIYQFRDVEPKIFLDKYDRYTNKNGGESVKFNFNWRSDREVLDFVNAVMNETMTADFGGIDYKAEAQLVVPSEKAVVSVDTPVPHVKVVWVDNGEQDDDASQTPAADYDIRSDKSEKTEDVNAEAIYIARYIKDALGKPYFDPKTKATRQLVYDDFAVLTRSNSIAVAIASVVRAEGIPVFQTADDADFYPSDRECLINYLKVLDNMQNDIPLASVLLSPLGGFNEKELLEVARNGGKNALWVSLTTYNGDQTLKTKIDDFISSIESHRLFAATSDVFTLLNRVVADYDYDAYLLGSPFGTERTERHNAFVNSLYGKGYADTVASFLRYADTAEFKVAQPAADATAVNVMTVHASKGLEFPVVILAGVKRKEIPDTSRLYLDREFGMAASYYDTTDRVFGKTISTYFFAKKKRMMERESELRLLYVALTRAQAHLLVVGKPMPDNQALFAEDVGTFGKWIKFAESRSGLVARVSQRVTLSADDCACAGLTSAIDVPECECDFSRLTAPYAHAAATMARAKYSVSSLNHDEAVEVKASALPYSDDGEDRAEIGTAYHAVLERVDLNRRDRAALCETIDGLVADGVFSEKTAQALSIDALVKVVQTEVFRYAAANRTEREKSFMLYLPLSQVTDNCDIQDKVLVQGVIDMLIWGDETVLVDYKYTTADSATVVARYRKQVDLYSQAVSLLTGKKVSRRVLVLIRSGEEIEL